MNLTDRKTILLGVISSLGAWIVLTIGTYLLSLPEFIDNFFGVDLSLWAYLILISEFVFLGALVISFSRSREKLALVNMFIQAISAFLFLIAVLFYLRVDNNHNRLSIIFVLLAAVLLIYSIVIKCLKINRADQICPMDGQIKSLKASTHTAVTGTAIPFVHNKITKHIETYLICNLSYDTQEWMFPGGHALIYDKRIYPERVAEEKALQEAGLVIDILSQASTEACFKENNNNRINELCPPHFTYKFVLHPGVKCYHEKGHLFHFDCVYISEIKEVKEKGNMDRLRLLIPIVVKEYEEIKNIVRDSIARTQREGRITLDNQNIEYVSKMLFEAYIRYKMIKKLAH